MPDRAVGKSVFAYLDDVESITADRDQLARAVADAELPALLACLAMLTGDLTLIGPDVRPPMPAMGASIQPQGGMPPEMQARARQRAIDALVALRDRSTSFTGVDDTVLEQCMRFLAKGAGAEYIPLLTHELALPRDMGAPGWSKTVVDPERLFRVAVIGAGFSGVAMAYRLQQAGIDHVLYERGPDVGGVWRDNVYPGCRLDTPNFAYSLSFAQKQDWPQQFSRQSEIKNYLCDIARTADIHDRIRFETEVISLEFDEPSSTWLLKARGPDGAVEERRFNAVITAVGQLNRPNLPAIRGMERFKGSAFHSAEWPKDIDLTGRRVAVVGAGASAFQIVPSIADQVAELKVFLRNPPWLLPTPNYHDDIKPGMTWLLKHVPYYGRWFRFWQFWIAAEGRLPAVQVEAGWKHPISVGAANESLRLDCMAHLERQFADRPDLLEKMTPRYPPGAKRMLRDNGVWAAAIKNPHVDLLTDRIDHITETGIVTSDGKLHEVDAIVFATGFLASDYLEPIEITGLGGRNLHEWWNRDCRAYLGVAVPRFPNLFMIGGPNTGAVVNGSALFSSECQVRYILSALEELLDKRLAWLDVRDDVFTSFNDRIDAGNLTKAWGVATVSSWYRNSANRASQIWPFSLLEFWQATEKLNATDYEWVPVRLQESVG